MNSRFIAGCVASVLVFTCSAVVVSAAVKEPKDAKCPVSGHECDPSASADLDGGKVYFCCEKCVAAFEGESAKFAAKAHQQMVSTGQLVQRAARSVAGRSSPARRSRSAMRKSASAAQTARVRSRRPPPTSR